MSTLLRPDPAHSDPAPSYDAAYYERLVIGNTARSNRRRGLAVLAVLLLAAGSHAAMRFTHRNENLRLAVAQNDDAQVRRLLAWGADPDLRASSVKAGDSERAGMANTHKTLLMVAVSGAHPAIANALLDRGANPNIQLQNGQSALMLAARDPAFVHVLLAHGANPKLRDSKGRTALLFATQTGDAEAIRDLLAHGASVEEADNAGQTALCIASATHHEEAVRVLLEHNANTDALVSARLATDDEDAAQSQFFRPPPSAPRHWMPLEWAAFNGSPSLIAAIWDTRLTPQERANQGIMAINRVTSSGSVDALQALLDRGVPVEIASPNDRSQARVYWAMPLWGAAMAHNLPMCRLLVERGAHVNAAFASGYGTPLMQAASDVTPDLVSFLLDHGADVNAQDATGMTALMRCDRSPEIAQILLSHGANVNARDAKGKSVLEYAYMPTVMQALLAHGADAHRLNNGADTLGRCSSPDVAEMLIAHGADVNARDKDGKTALLLSWYSNVTPVLLAHGADVNAHDREGNTPLHVAVERNSTESIKALLARGADRNAANVHGVTPLMLAQQKNYKPVMDAFK